jgi:hypothetical protein
MAATRRLHSRFVEAAPQRRETGVGVWLRFDALRSRADSERIEDWADLGPALTVPAVQGLGKVLRLLRAARIAAPRDPLGLVGQEGHAGELLLRAVGTEVRLTLRPRTRVRFLAWTENGVETVHDVEDVTMEGDAYLVRRFRGRFPLRFERSKRPDPLVRAPCRIETTSGSLRSSASRLTAPAGWTSRCCT